MTTVVVVGGDAAGATAASTAKRLDPSLDVVMLERGPDTSYSACGIPYWVSGDVRSSEKLVARSPDEHRRRGIDVRTGSTATAIDTSGRSVEINSHEHISYDRLLVATGGRPRRPPIPGIERAFGVQTLDDARRLQSHLARVTPRMAVVAGGGYIGLEMAEAFIKRGIETHLVERSPHVMGTLDAEMAELVEEALRNEGVELHLETEVREVHDDRVITSAGEHPAEVVVLGLGSGPETTLGEAAGLALGAGDAFVTDDRMATGTEAVWAAGDCAEVFHRVAGRRVSIQLGTVANKAGRVAGMNMAGGHARFPGVVGTAVSKICRYEVARTGLSTSECSRYGFDGVAVTIAATTRAGYYPGSGPISVRLIGDRADGRLLGGQIVGVEGAAKRIDVVATALWNRMMVEEVVDLDLSYAPPFSSVWDPVQVGARELLKEL